MIRHLFFLCVIILYEHSNLFSLKESKNRNCFVDEAANDRLLANRLKLLLYHVDCFLPRAGSVTGSLSCPKRMRFSKSSFLSPERLSTQPRLLFTADCCACADRSSRAVISEISTPAEVAPGTGARGSVNNTVACDSCDGSLGQGGGRHWTGPDLQSPQLFDCSPSSPTLPFQIVTE